MNTTGKFTRLNPAHLDFTKVLDLDQTQFPRPWSAKDWQELNWDHHFLFGWHIENQLVGFSLFSFIPGDDSAHLLKVCVQTDLRGLGTAQAFWVNCQDYLKTADIISIYLEVEAHNQRAIGFYDKLGFQTLRKNKGYYSDGSDAVIMQMTF
jgi:ribosomal protein S18 acetylase RimI-like enzyme